MWKDQKHLHEDLVDPLKIGFVRKTLQSNRGDRRDQTDKNVDARDQNETGRGRFEEIIDRIHQRDDGETVEEQ